LPPSIAWVAPGSSTGLKTLLAKMKLFSGLSKVVIKTADLGEDKDLNGERIEQVALTRKQLAAQVEVEEKAKRDRNTELLAARFREEVRKREEDERREALKKGIRTHPGLRKLDALVLQMQREEELEYTNYLDWRDDLIEAVRSNHSVCASEQTSARDTFSTYWSVAVKVAWLFIVQLMVNQILPGEAAHNGSTSL
jgi:hypothetical protein